MNYIDKLRDKYFEKINYHSASFSPRFRRDVMARNAFMTACRGVFTTHMIGESLNKSHSTVVHATKIHDSNSKFSAEYREYYMQAKKIIDHAMATYASAPGQRGLSSTKLDLMILEKDLKQAQKDIKDLKNMVLSLRSKIDVIQ